MENINQDLSEQVAHASLVDDHNDDEEEGEEDEEEDEDEEDEEDDEDDPMQDLPPSVVARVEQLQDLNAEREKIMMQYLEERAALELKYRLQYQPLYEKRARIVNGTKEDDAGPAPRLSQGPSVDASDPQGIPQFWVCAMGHEENVAELLTEEDVDCLEYLTDITCVDFDDGKGFELQFLFSEQNTYFTNPVLTKTYHVPNLLVADEPILKNVIGCTIDWKEGKCLTYKTIKKKQRGKGKHSGQIRIVDKQERKDSFFHFFLPPKLPNMENMDEDEAERLEEAFDADFDVAQAFRLHIVPKAVLWFTGQGDAEEMQLAMISAEELEQMEAQME